MEQRQPRQEGRRETKRRETLRRISETGLRLFIANGYEATTLDAIAEESGIARRTFFYYFKSKEDILLTWQNGLPEALRDAVLAEPTDQNPLDAILNALLKLVGHFHTDRAVLIGRIMRSSEHLRASSQAKFLQQEEAVFEALCERWPGTNRRSALRMVAMISVGALRLAIENWTDDGGKGSLGDYLKQSFGNLKVEIANA